MKISISVSAKKSAGKMYQYRSKPRAPDGSIKGTKHWLIIHLPKKRFLAIVYSSSKFNNKNALWKIQDKRLVTSRAKSTMVLWSFFIPKRKRSHADRHFIPIIWFIFAQKLNSYFIYFTEAGTGTYNFTTHIKQLEIKRRDI